MMSTLKAELRKLLTVRSTYVISLVFLLLGAFFTFYIHGFKDASVVSGSSAAPGAALFAAGSITQVANILSLACALVALLLLSHEYRYNTITYTLTTSNNRSKVLASKIIAVLVYGLVYSVVATAILLPLVWAGATAAGHPLPLQDINLLTFFVKVVFFCEAFALAGLLFITLIRNQIGAIVVLLISPNTIEGLLSLVLKGNSVYLPFTALQQVVQPPVLVGAIGRHIDTAATGTLTAPKGALVFLCYLIVAWVIAWILFIKRDAN